MSQQAVIDAWADMAGWVEQTLPGLATAQTLDDINQDIGDIGACNVLNVPDGDDPVIWESAGDATIAISSLRISSMTDVQILPAVLQPDATYSLPLQFGTLQVQGVYNYTQPCVQSDDGHDVSTSTAPGNGSIAWTVSNGTLTYTASMNGQLTITGAQIGGATSVAVNPNTGGLPSWLVAIGNFFSSFNEQQALTAAVADVFQQSTFTEAMQSLLDAELSGGA